MSAQGQVTDFLRALKPEGDTVMLDPNQIALQTGVSREQVNKTLYNLKAHGRLEILRGANGREISGIRIIDLEPRQRGGSRAGSGKQERVRYADPIHSDAPTRRSGLRTPALDEYARAKSRFESLRSELGDLVEASFRENPYAEEGLRLRERLGHMEAQLISVRTEKDEVERDYRSLRARKHADIALDAERNGVMVKSGD